MPFYVFTALHSPTVGAIFVYVAAAFFVLDRLIRGFWGLWPRKTVSLMVKPGGIVCLQLPRHPLATYRVGSYVFLNIPSLSFVQWHPYTLSSGPDDDCLEIHIKSLGDHTQKLYERAKDRGSFWVRVDGPYGAPRFNHRRFEAVMLVGGGVGVTPCISALKDIYRVRMSRSRRSAKQQRNAAKLVYLVWSAQQPEHSGWFSDVLADCFAKSE